MLHVLRMPRFSLRRFRCHAIFSLRYCFAAVCLFTYATPLRLTLPLPTLTLRYIHIRRFRRCSSQPAAAAIDSLLLFHAAITLFFFRHFVTPPMRI